MPLYTLSVNKNFLFILPCFIYNSITGQTTQDTSVVLELDEVVVKAYDQNKRLKDIPAAINYIDQRVLERFSPASIVQAISTTPGVRLEERSPGSYRLNIRGSALRSPFGVRNVKVYYNDLPFTNPGGHTYLNQLGVYNFGSLEIIKGPGSSLYGAGTGGVALIEHASENEKPGVYLEYTPGSDGLQNIYAGVVSGKEKFRSKTGFQHQESNGYRAHSSLRRDILSWTGNFNLSETRSLKTTFVYGDLFYKTPGALTSVEYNKDPKLARPGSSLFPGAEVAQASVRLRTLLTGVLYTHEILSGLKSKTALYGSFTQLLNPAIQNYGRVSEPHFGGRTLLNFVKPVTNSVVSLNAGIEWQQGFSNVSVHRNKSGLADTLQQYYEVANRQSIVFAQALWDIDGWSASAGISMNGLNVRYQPFFPRPLPEQKRRFTNKLAPRLGLLKKVHTATVYTSIAKGFSTPTTEEFFPSGGIANIDLNAEDGINYDLGIRWNFKRLKVDVNMFHFSLRNTIVQQRTAGGGAQYVNAGNTSQNGTETSIIYSIKPTLFLEEGIFWLSHTYHHFIYKQFSKDSFNFSGSKLPGIAPHTVSTGLDLHAVNGMVATVSYLFTDTTPLTDANNIYAKPYHLVSAKIGFNINAVKKWNIKLMAGADNLLNENYSLGNDINGFGGRYFNPAPLRSYYASLTVRGF